MYTRGIQNAPRKEKQKAFTWDRHHKDLTIHN